MHRISWAILILSALSTGCCCHCCHLVRHKPFHVWHFWADWNTLGEPAIFCERIEHLPYESHRVGRYRWMYGLNPGLAGNREGIGPIAARSPASQEWATQPHTPGQPPNPLAPAPGEEPLDGPPAGPTGHDGLPVPPPPASQRSTPPAFARTAVARSTGAWLWQSVSRDFDAR